MNALQIRRWTDSEPTEVEFVGWKDRTRRVFWVRNGTGARREITLQLPGAGKIRFSDASIPDFPPVRITRAALCLPACRGSKEEAVALHTKNSNENLCAQQFSAWELFTSHVLCPDSGDDSALRASLLAYTSRLRNEHGAKLLRMKKLPPEKAREERKALKPRFSFFRKRSRTYSLVPVWKATLADVKDGFGGILQSQLHQWWAKEYGFDIKEIGEDAQRFRLWLESVGSNTKLNVFNASTRLRLTEDAWRVHQACVRYQMDFSDGTRAWVDGIVEADITDVQSLREFDEIVHSHKPPESPAWHSEGFGVISRHNSNGEEVDTLPLSNEFRALCQLLDERPDKTMQFSEIEPKIGSRTRDLDLAAGQSKAASPSGKRRLRDMLGTKTGKKLKQWKVLTETKKGREKFITLSSTTVAK